MSNYIKADKAQYVYEKGRFSLKPMDFSLKKEETTFIVGRNGSGKSTLGKLLAGIYKPSKGMVYIDQVSTFDLTLGQIGQRIGYLWQKPELQLFAPTVREELTFVDSLKKVDEKEILQKSNEWMAYFEIGHLAQRSSFYLSRGEKQRLALATVVSGGATYLILDEPTTGLDEQRKKNLGKLLMNLRDQKRIGMCIISHDKNFVNLLSQRTLTMGEGEIIDDQHI